MSHRFIKLLLVGSLATGCLSLGSSVAEAARPPLPGGAPTSRPPSAGHPHGPGRVATLRVAPGGYSIFGGKQATLTWSRSPGATAYQLSSRLLTDAGSPWNLLPYKVTRRSWTLQPLLLGRRYQFRVRPFKGSVPGPAAVSTPIRMRGLPAHRLYAALGDSYSSGLGADGRESGGDCHRNSRAWAYALQRQHQSKTKLLACAGATMSGVEAQLRPMRAFFAQDPGAAQLITVTVGGNDVGFASVLQNCTLHSCTASEQGLSRRIAATGPRLAAFYREIHAAQPFADILAGGYPQVVEPRGSSSNLLCRGINGPERDMLNRLSTQLDLTIARAAGAAGIWSVGLAVRQAFLGHSACARTGEWIHAGALKIGGIHGLISPKTFHPKDDGQAAYVDAFNQTLLERSA
ncbi:MAG: lipase [Marmoricola sp.]|nr:lipase [Marmoricola sp.]